MIAAFLFEHIICINAIPVGAGLPAKAAHQIRRSATFAGKPAPTKAMRCIRDTAVQHSPASQLLQKQGGASDTPRCSIRRQASSYKGNAVHQTRRGAAFAGKPAPTPQL
jgi:hypothetical protein